MILPLFLLAISTTIPPVISPTTTPPTSEVQKIREAVQQKVREKLQQITSSTEENQIKGYIGTITKIEATEIIIDHNGNSRRFGFTPETIYIDLKRNKAKIDTLKINQEILAMGRIDQNGILQASRIVAVESGTSKAKYQIIFGKITDISQTSPVFSLIPFANKNQQYQIKTDTSTEIYSGKKSKIQTKDLQKGHRVITITKIGTTTALNAISIINLDYQAPITPSPPPTGGPKP